MAEKEPVIVIKKITIQAAGAHGGSWKVAFADFMTALMAFFLVMWLISQSEEVKQNVSDYFSTPSIIEYNFSNYGVELTLEKLFLDMMNEPLRVFETFITPIDRTPNIMSMGTKKIVMHHLAEQLAEQIGSIEIYDDEIKFEIKESLLFAEGTADPSNKFVEIMEKVAGIVQGLEDTNVYIDSEVYFKPSQGSQKARNTAEARLDLILKKIEAKLDNNSVELYKKAKPVEFIDDGSGEKTEGKIRFRLKQKEFAANGKRNRKIEDLYGDSDDTMAVYEKMVKKVTEDRKNKVPPKLRYNFAREIERTKRSKKTQ